MESSRKSKKVEAYLCNGGTVSLELFDIAKNDKKICGSFQVVKILKEPRIYFSS